ncbi:MAG: indolepyruvate oxidoreductase subunit beta family protein [Rhodocyclales bacterium]|nr:indolepyruvate oxidoreductase subunit beta family protein [Rhodocyclales bacterium]
MSALPERPITILIAALGGEGGGVLAEWLVDAAVAQGFPVQSTSIPGVSQRTGATTYYVEIYPVRAEELGGRRPVLALTPSPGNIDVMVASELIEAGRAMQNGFVSPERTTLIASTHRIFATSEKMQMGDGRYDSGKVLVAAKPLAKKTILSDMAQIAQQAGTIINTVLYGAVVGSGALPLSKEACEAAIRKSGKAVESSLKGFELGYACARGEAVPGQPAPEKPAPNVVPAEWVRSKFPAPIQDVLALGVTRLTDYQDSAYANLYLERLAPVLVVERQAGGEAEGFPVTRETARQLALWMSYEDVIRVADLKTRRDRFERVRQEAGVEADQPHAIVEYLKPGVEEIADILPPAWAAWLRRRAEASGWQPDPEGGLEVKTTTVAGFLMLKAMSRLRPFRRASSRYAEEQALIERWLAAIREHAAKDREAAPEIADCARLIKGYGDTHRRGRGNFVRIFETLIEGKAGTPGLAARVRAARDAALADAEGKNLAETLTGTRSSSIAGAKGQTVVFMPRPAQASAPETQESSASR